MKIEDCSLRLSTVSEAKLLFRTMFKFIILHSAASLCYNYSLYTAENMKIQKSVINIIEV